MWWLNLKNARFSKDMSTLRRYAPVLTPTKAISAKPGEEVLEVSNPASTAASVYEKVRNTIDYQEEHLLRRNAIFRMMRRFAGEGGALSDHAAELLKELVWARYLPNKTVPVTFAETLAIVLRKYEPLLAVAVAVKTRREEAVKFVIDLLATEIEETIAPTKHLESLASLMYEEVKKRIDWDPSYKLSEEEKDLRLFVAVHRVLLKSVPGTLRYRILTLYYPDWSGLETPTERVEQIADNLEKIFATIDNDIKHPMTEKLMRLLRRKAGIYRVIGDLVVATPDAAQLDNAEYLDLNVEKILSTRTNDFKTRLRRTVVRAVAFLFITKMLLALIIELPFDYFFAADDLPLYPLFINILFHPFLLAVIGLTVSVPTTKNLTDYKELVRAVAVGADHPLLHVRVKNANASSWRIVFYSLYGLIFLGVYSAIAFALHTINFHALSIGLFLFFLSLVTFFGIRIRMSTRDLVVSDARSGIIGSTFDILSLPIVRAGSWLSTKVAKINVFIYFFDFIVEAPLKVAIEFVESWLAFIREKKDEI